MNPTSAVSVAFDPLLPWTVLAVLGAGVAAALADAAWADATRARLETAMEGESRDEINAAAEALETLSKPFAERRMDRGIREALSGMSMGDLESRVGE